MNSLPEITVSCAANKAMVDLTIFAQPRRLVNQIPMREILKLKRFVAESIGEDADIAQEILAKRKTFEESRKKAMKRLEDAPLGDFYSLSK